jgi:hypothetical protein
MKSDLKSLPDAIRSMFFGVKIRGFFSEPKLGKKVNKAVVVKLVDTLS